MFELAGTRLGDFHVGNERKDDVGRISLLKMGFNAESICGIHQNTGVLGGDDGFNHGGKIVDVWQSFHAEDDIVVGIFTR